MAFIDNQPDEFWKYVLIHELGHYFGLCHVDGIDRIMVSTREKSWWDWSVLPNLLYLSGEPEFVLDEAAITYATVGGLFLLTGVAAVATPVYKAAMIEPVVALRQRT